jgi:hypothetical protein
MNKANHFLFSFIGLVIFQVLMNMEQLYGNYPIYLEGLAVKVHKYIPFIPSIRVNDQVLIFASLLFIFLFILIGIAVFLDSRWARTLTVTIGCIEILNGSFHIVTSLYFMLYIPGSICAAGLIFFGVLVVLIKPTILKGAIEEES